MSAFVLQTLSSDRAFGVKLNKTFDGHSSLPNSVRLPAFHGTYADFVIIVSALPWCAVNILAQETQFP